MQIYIKTNIKKVTERNNKNIYSKKSVVEKNKISNTYKSYITIKNSFDNSYKKNIKLIIKRLNEKLKNN